MCLEDMRIGQATAVTQTTKLIGVASAQVVGSDPNRKVLIFTGGAVSRITFSLANPAILDVGVNIGILGSQVEFTVERDGDMVTQPWFAIAFAATNVAIYEGHTRYKEV